MDDIFFTIIAVLAIVILIFIVFHLILVVLSMIAVAFDLSFINGESVLRIIFE